MWKMAWRNLWRNRLRTLIALTAISLSQAMFIVMVGMMAGIYGTMEETALKSAGGNLLVHDEGYWLERSNELVIRSPDDVLSTIRGVEGVDWAIPRVMTRGLASSARGNAPVQLSGIDPEAERVLIDLSPYVTEGTFLAGDESDPLVLGRGIVDDLEIELGDRVVLTATDPDGQIVSALFHLSGVLETNMADYDDFAAYTTISVAQRAVGSGDGLTQIGVLLHSDDQREIVRDRIGTSLGDRADELEILTWREAVPELVGAIELDRSFGVIYSIIILVIVGFGIANTFLMSVAERVREFGLLGAIGLTPKRIRRMVFLEALCLALVSIAIGFAIGIPCHLYLVTSGIDIAAFGDIEFGGIMLLDTLMHSRDNPEFWVVSTAVVLVTVLASAFYPARRANKLDPAEAMRMFDR